MALFYGHRRWQYAALTATGESPVAGYALYVYTDQALAHQAQLYDRADASTAVPVGQPLIGDATGFVNLYAPTGVYWFKVTSNTGAAHDAASGKPLGFPDTALPDPVTIEDSMDRWKGLEVFDPTTAYYGAKADYATDDRTAWINAFKDMNSLDAGVFLVPRGKNTIAGSDPVWTFDYQGTDTRQDRITNKLYDLGYTITGYGNGQSHIYQGADMANDAIFEMLGRSEPNNGKRLQPGFLGNLSYHGNGFKGNLVNFWQPGRWRFAHMQALGVLGTAIQLTAASDYLIEDVYCDTVGDPSTSAPAFQFMSNDEGGTTIGWPRYGTMRDCVILNSPDHAIYARWPRECRWENIRINGTGGYHAGAYIIDAEDCDFDLRVEAATRSGLYLASTGKSTGNKIRGHYSGCGTWGVHVAKNNLSQTHGPTSIDGAFGFEGANGSGDISIPLDGQVVIAGSATFASGGINVARSASPRPLWNTIDRNVAVGVPFIPNPSQGDEFRLTPTTSGSTITVGSPTLNSVPGQEFTVSIIGNGVNTITWDPVYKFPSAGPFVQAVPANGKQRSWRFRTGISLTAPNYWVVGGSGGDM